MHPSAQLLVSPDEEEEAAAALLLDEPPPAFMNTMGVRRSADRRACSADRLASSAARSATSIVSPQCLHFLATASTSSPQNGQSFVSFAGCSGMA
jgi:hypothetical protein